MFKTMSFGALATAAAAICLPAPAIASTVGGSLATSATVTANCTVSTTPLAFGNVDSTSASNVDATGGLSITCTNGSAWTASAGVGAGSGASYASRKMTAGSDLLNYNIYTSAARTTVWGDGTASTGTIGGTGNGSAQSFSVTGSMTASQAGTCATASCTNTAATNKTQTLIINY